MNRRTCWSALLLLPLLACSADKLNSPFTQPDLGEARERWNALGLERYVVEMKYACFCGFPASRWLVVRVESDSIVSATLLDASDSPDAGPLQLPWLPTVTTLFERIQAERDRPDGFVEGRYDTATGMPVFAVIGTLANDAGTGYELRRLRRLR